MRLISRIRPLRSELASTFTWMTSTGNLFELLVYKAEEMWLVRMGVRIPQEIYPVAFQALTARKAPVAFPAEGDDVGDTLNGRRHIEPSKSGSRRWIVT